MERHVKLLLASAGITKAGVRAPLVELLGRPIAESIKVVDGAVEVVSEGQWRLSAP
jgi:hypothetical protein